MATFLIQKRMNLGRLFPAGALIIDPPDIGLLIERGYILPVADDYPGEVLELGPEYRQTAPDPEPQVAEPLQLPTSSSEPDPVQQPSPPPTAEPDQTTDQPSPSGTPPELPKVIDLSGVEVPEAKATEAVGV